MSEVIWHTMMSLDGFITGPDDSMDWAFEQPGRSALADETRERIGAIVAGRRWYDVATARYDGRQGIYGGRWDGRVVVLTHDPPSSSPDPGISFASTLDEALAAARKAAGDRAVGIFGAETARQCLEAGVIDEVIVHIAPVLLGDGVRFHDAPGTERIRLERIAGDASGQVADLRFRVTR
jgi:dihydrofolate reductase